MTEWIKDNLGKAFSAFGVIVSIVSFLVGVYVTQKDLGNDIEKLQTQIQDLKDGDIWWIKQKLNHSGDQMIFPKE